MIKFSGSRLARGLMIALVTVSGVARAQSSGNAPFVPNDPWFAPQPDLGFAGQWYLQNRAPETLRISLTINGQPIAFDATNIGLDANLAPAWERGLTGQGVVIGIVGITGFAGDHPDLAPNYRTDLSRQFSQDLATRALPQGPLSALDNHDTAVAGIAAARGGNGIGMTGAAPFAGVAGFRIDNPDNSINALANQNYVEANYFASGVDAWGRITGYAEVSVRNRSYARVQPFAVEDPRVIASLNDTADNNVINVFAAGNFRGSPTGDTGRMQRNSLASAIAVTSLGSDGTFASDANYGASVFVTAPGARIDFTGFLAPSVDRVASDGYNPGTLLGDPLPDQDYTSLFNGTSATAPIVSGIVALGKELNPFLDVRMARHAFATTSRIVDANDASSTGGWQTNGAGLHFNPNYGFGLVDAAAFVNRVEETAFVTAPQSFTTGTRTPAATNRTLGAGGSVESIVLDAAAFASAGVNRLPLEAVEVTLDVSSINRDALQGTLVSPAGTRSTFMTASHELAGYQPVFADPEPAAGLQWTFVANTFWGEDPLGTWQLSLADLAGSASTWNSYDLTFHLGQVVLESGQLAIATNTTAHSVVLDRASTQMTIAAGAAFSVRDEFWINRGTLRVEGRLQDLATTGLGRSRLRLNGGQLTGTGTIATSLGVLNAAGTIRPGDDNVIGTLTIAGGFAQESAGVLEIDLASNTQVDALVVNNGNATLGGTLRLNRLPGATIVAGPLAPIIRTENGQVGGAFAAIEGTRLAPTLSLRHATSAANLFQLEAYRDYRNPEVTAGFTPGEQELAAYLTAVSNRTDAPFEEMLRSIDRQSTTTEAAGAIRAVAPLPADLAPTLALAGDSARLDSVLQRARSARPAGSATHAWFADASYLDGNVDATTRRAGFSQHDRGLLAGIDHAFNPALAGGLFLGVSESRATLDHTSSRLEGEHRAIGVRATWTHGENYATAALQHGWTTLERSRQVAFPGVLENVRSESDARQLGLAVEAGRTFEARGWFGQLFGGVRFLEAKIDGYDEPGDFGWSVSDQRSRSTVGQIGGDVWRVIAFDGFSLQPFASLAVAHEFESSDYGVTAGLPGAIASGLRLQAERTDRDYVTAQAGLAVQFTDSTRLYFAVNSRIAESDASRTAVNLGLQRAF